VALIDANPFADVNVLQFAAEELSKVIGLDYPGRIFLAGGAFKTLLHGIAPRDLDIWAPSAHDREQLVAWLRSRALAPPRRSRFADIFRVADRDVEVPDQTDQACLENLLARFDLGLSAIGVELDRGKLRCVVNPLARESIRCEEILLLKPLVNWRHCLGTLARARRYACELHFEFPKSEEAVIWEMFDSQDVEMQRGMLERYKATPLCGWNVLEDVTHRLRCAADERLQYFNFLNV